MRAGEVYELDGNRMVRLTEREMPRAGGGEVLVEVRGAGVTPTELAWYPTTHGKDGSKREGAVPGHEFAGVVASVGEGVLGFAVGDAVFGMNDWFDDGATAEFVVAVPGQIARKPGGLSFAEAATVPIAALTAWQGLFVQGKLERGERVLVHGGAGSVGLFAVQMARRAGAEVVTTASEKDVELLQGLGANVVIDYREERFEERVSGVDVVFDTVGGATLARSWSVLGEKGRVVTIASDAETNAEPRVKAAFFIVEADGRRLAALGEMLERGELRTFVKAIFELEKAGEAYAGKAGIDVGRHGKTVLQVGGAHLQERVD